MRERLNLFYPWVPGDLELKKLLNVLDNPVHTTYCRNDPQFISNTSASICPAVTLEEVLRYCRWSFCQLRFILIFQDSLKISLQIRMVDKTSARHCFRKMAYRKTVFNYIFAF